MPASKRAASSAAPTAKRAKVAALKKPSVAATTQKKPAKAEVQRKESAQVSESQADALPRLGSMKTKEIAALIEQSVPYKASLRPAAIGKALRILSWNVNGLSALVKKDKDAIRKLVEREKADAIFLQETKLQSKDTDAVAEQCVPAGWRVAWSCSRETLGYAGVAVLWRPGLDAKVTSELGHEDFDKEGRFVSLELSDVHLVGCYVPNAGDGLKRLPFRLSWEQAIAKRLKDLSKDKPVIYTGDLNVCHQELDLWGNHAANSKSAGYSPQEREAMTTLLEGNDIVDSFRHLHMNVRAFTYFSHRFNARAKNNGWRLDYFLLTRRLLPRLHDSFVLTDVVGSDHCPIGCVLRC